MKFLLAVISALTVHAYADGDIEVDSDYNQPEFAQFDQCASRWVYRNYKSCENIGYGVNRGDAGVVNITSYWSEEIDGDDTGDKVWICPKVAQAYTDRLKEKGHVGLIALPQTVFPTNEEIIKPNGIGKTKYKYQCRLDVVVGTYSSGYGRVCGYEDGWDYSEGRHQSEGHATCLSCDGMENNHNRLARCLTRNIKATVGKIDLSQKDVRAVCSQVVRVLESNKAYALEAFESKKVRTTIVNFAQDYCN